jgi:hypothetical protein
MSSALASRHAALKLVVAFKARRRHFPIGMIPNQRPVSFELFIPKRDIPFLLLFQIEKNDIGAAVIVSINRIRNAFRLCIRNREVRVSSTGTFRM